VERSRLDPEELMGFIGDTACYIVNGRRQIRGGETMGASGGHCTTAFRDKSGSSPSAPREVAGGSSAWALPAMALRL
jgi:hypothetical protein